MQLSKFSILESTNPRHSWEAAGAGPGSRMAQALIFLAKLLISPSLSTVYSGGKA